MTEILIATRDTVLVTPGTGEKFRLIRGRTLADARHPAAAAYPDNFMPVEVELGYDGPDNSDDENASDVIEEYRAELAEARATADSYRAQLTRIVDELRSRGLMPQSINTDREGWLAEAVASALDAPVPDEPVLPPAKPAARTAAKR
jgi:hypothetical protein